MDEVTGVVRATRAPTTAGVPPAPHGFAAAGRWIAALAAALLVMALVGCGSGGSGGSTASTGGASSGGRGTVLRIGVPYVPTDLDPANGTNLGTPIPGQIWSATLLANSAADGSIIPGLAIRFGYVGRGNKVYEMQLRRDARFSDGTPVTSADVKAWIDYYARRSGSPAAGLIPVSSVDTPDRWTVRINLRTSDSGIEGYIGQGWGWGYIAKVDDLRALSKNPVGAGPYVMVPSETVAGDHYTYVPNKYYYDPSLIHYDKIVVKVLANPTTMLQAIKSGQIDVAIGDYTTAPAAESAGLTVGSAAHGWAGIVLEDRGGTLAKPLGDVRVRQALNYAIDRRAITEAMLGKYGAPTSEIYTQDAFDPSYQDHYPFDAAKARQLLADAGYANGFTLKTVVQADNGNVGAPMAQAVAKYLSAVGVKLDIRVVPSEAEMENAIASRQYPAWFKEAPGPAMEGYFACCIKKGGPANKYGWSDPVMERLAQQAAVAPSDQVQVLWRAVSRRSADVAAFVPVFLTPTIVYSTGAVDGVRVTPWFYFAPVVSEWHPK